MSTATDRSVGAKWLPSAPAAEVLPERGDNPEWHSLRLFGRRRHPDALDSAGETRAEL